MMHALSYVASFFLFGGIIVGLVLYGKHQNAEAEVRKAAMVCPHCGVKGAIDSRKTTRYQDVIVGFGLNLNRNATVLTKGISCRCSNCHTKWTIT